VHVGKVVQGRWLYQTKPQKHSSHGKKGKSLQFFLLTLGHFGSQSHRPRVSTLSPRSGSLSPQAAWLATPCLLAPRVPDPWADLLLVENAIQNTPASFEAQKSQKERKKDSKNLNSSDQKSNYS